MEQYAMYLRKSRTDAEAEVHSEGETLARHRTQLFALADKLDLKIDKVYEEVISGDTIASRPVVQELLDDVASGMWAGVLCMEIERLARGDSIDQGIVARAFKYSATKIITPTKTYNPSNEFDEEYFEFALFMSRREYKTINRRMQAGRIASIKEGNYIGSRPPYGYKKIRDYEKRCFTLEPIPNEAEAVNMIYNMYVNERIGANKIATRLNNMGIPPKRIDYWSASSIMDILHNPVYIGKNRWNWRKVHKKIENGQVILSRPKNKFDDYDVYDALHPAIISQELWDSAQSTKISEKRYNGSFSKPMKNPFTGLILCGMCGRNISRQSGRGVTMLLCKHKGCACVGSRLDLVDELIYKALLDAYHKHYVDFYKCEDRQENVRAELERLNREMQNIKTQKNSLYDLLEQGVYSAGIFMERTELLKTKQALILSQIEEKMISLEKNIFLKSKLCLNEVIDKYFSVSEPKEKNTLLSSVIDKIIYTKTVRERSKQESDLKVKVQLLF